MFKTFTTSVLAATSAAMSIKNSTQAFNSIMDLSDSTETCSKDGWTESGQINWIRGGTTIENTIITCEPDTEFCVKANNDNITLRNVIIYHPANGMGLFSWKAANLTLENVQIIAYGNEWGAQPCPTKAPMNGYRCSNMEISWAENLVIRNTEVENGSRGISLRFSDGAVLDHVVARNVRGPQPGGECFQFLYSDHVTMTNFHCKNDLEIGYNADAISIWRSSHAHLEDGVVDGNTSPTGQCIMFEGSEHGTKDGYLVNVEAINCKGCFGAFPLEGLYSSNNACASPICQSNNPVRGAQPVINLWTAGANVKEGVYASDIEVHNSFVYDLCPEGEYRLAWEYEQGMITEFDVTELTEFTPKTPPSANLPWDASCWTPVADCRVDFTQESWGSEWTDRTSVLDPTLSTWEVPVGHCYGNETWFD